jgi:hypothetical protein
MTCEYCNAPMMIVHPPPPPQPVVTFAAPDDTTRRSAGAVIGITVGVFALVGAMLAVFMVSSRPHVDPPPPPVIPNVPEPPPMPAPENGGGVTAAGLSAMFETQCEQGDAQSCLVAGTLHENGTMGAKVDAAKARAFYERGCKLGNPAACSKAKMR